MARHFVDTSALVKLYREEPGTAEVQSAIGAGDTLLISGITFLEFQSAFFSLVRQRLITEAQARARLGLLRQDLPNFEIIPLLQSHVASAELLVEQFGVAEGLRPADALQLACALAAHAAMPLDSLLTTDTILGRCAAAAGLVTKP